MYITVWKSDCFRQEGAGLVGVIPAVLYLHSCLPMFSDSTSDLFFYVMCLKQKEQVSYFRTSEYLYLCAQFYSRNVRNAIKIFKLIIILFNESCSSVRSATVYCV